MRQKQAFSDGYARSGFCMQAALLLKSAVPLYEGLQVMSEDAGSEAEREILTAMAEQLKVGESFSHAVKQAGCFPSYMEEMILLGERTGTMDAALESLAAYYDQEARMADGLRRALTYPAMMVFMLLLILFVLFTKIMPVFSGVYEQLGATIPPAAEAAIRTGGLLSGLCLAVCLVMAVGFLLLGAAKKAGKQPSFAAAVLQKFSSHSKISRMAAIRRFCGVMSVTLRCGLRLEEGLDIAVHLAGNQQVSESIAGCKSEIASGSGFYDAVKKAGLFTGFDLQLIRVASRAGRLEQTLSQMADDYDRNVSDSLDSMMSRLEPVIVSVLAVAVGLVLLSVMVPLAGILTAIG